MYLAVVGDIALRATQDAALAPRVAFDGLHDREDRRCPSPWREPVATMSAEPRVHKPGTHQLAHDLPDEAHGNLRPARYVRAGQHIRFLGQQEHGANGVVPAPSQLQSHRHSSPQAKGAEIGPNGPCQRPFETLTILVFISRAVTAPRGSHQMKTTFRALMLVVVVTGLLTACATGPRPAWTYNPASPSVGP